MIKFFLIIVCGLEALKPRLEQMKWTELKWTVIHQLTWGPIYKISYDLSYDYLKFIVRSTYDSDLRPGPHLSVWMHWAGSLLEAPTHRQML